jgi:hypothetical protein
MSHRGQQSHITHAQPPSWQPSVDSSRASSHSPIPSNGFTHKRLADPDEFEDDELDEMGDRRPPLHRPTDRKSHTPLLNKDDEERGRTGYDSPSLEAAARPPLFTRRSTMRSRSPDTQAKFATRKKYTYAAFFLGLSLVSFVVQTETAVYIQHELGWNKAYCMLCVFFFLSLSTRGS